MNMLAACRPTVGGAWTLKQASAEPISGLNICPTIRIVVFRMYALSRRDPKRYAPLTGRLVSDDIAGLIS